MGVDETRGAREIDLMLFMLVLAGGMFLKKKST